MAVIKNILIFHQQGLEVLVPYMVEAISEVMNCFPQYKDMFPIKNMGNWASPNARMVHEGHNYLCPYESIEWYIERAKERATREGRWPDRGQISIDQMFNDLNEDPYFKRIPQWGIYLTKHDLYGGGANRFCLGCTRPDGFSVISIRRLLDRQNHLNLENFQTVVQHEFGHILRLTEGDRPNTRYYLGEHCTDPNCIMQQREDGDFSDVTERRLERKAKGLPPICPDCIIQGRQMLSGLCAAYERKFNPNTPGHGGGRG